MAPLNTGAVVSATLYSSHPVRREKGGATRTEADWKRHRISENLAKIDGWRWKDAHKPISLTLIFI